MRFEKRSRQTGSTLRTTRGRTRRPVLLAAIVVLAALVPAAAAQAAAKPTVTTEGAHGVTYNSATLNGAVNPNGANTSYYFQYGPTKAYGAQTPIGDVGAGAKPIAVKAAVTGLLPLTVYHYRTVAVNSAGATLGADHTLLTTKVPLSLAILVSPNPSPFGGTIVIQGMLAGTNDANREVVLQGNEFPFTAGFVNVGNAEKTDATGHFSFTLLGKPSATQFRVVTTTTPAIVSPITTAFVAVRVTSHIARTKRHGFARIYGTVTPAEDGMKIAMLRISNGKGVLAGGTVLKHASATSSTFSRVVPVKKGIYRVLAQITGVGQSPSYGVPLVVR